MQYSCPSSTKDTPLAKLAESWEDLLFVVAGGGEIQHSITATVFPRELRSARLNTSFRPQLVSSCVTSFCKNKPVENGKQL